MLFTTIILGDGYKGKADSQLFFSDAKIIQDAILATEPFHSLKNNLSFIMLPSKISLGCDDSAPLGFEQALTCDINKIKKVVTGLPMNRIIVVCNGKGRGGNDAQVCFVGTGNHADNSICSFKQSLAGVALHEYGHSFGLVHNHVQQSIMNDVVNYGCDFLRYGFTLAEQEIIKAEILKVVAL